MKKLLVALLTLVLCVSAFTACVLQDPNAPQQTTPNVTYNPEAAAAYVFNLYKDKSVTAADFDVTAVANVAGVSYTVEWSVDTDKVTITKKNDTTYTVNVDEESAEELAYVLTATIKAGDGSTATKTFNLTVPKYNLWSHEDYMAAKEKDENGDPTIVVVKGIVVAINSKSAGNKYNHLFLADLEGKGGYYCYSMAKDPIADDGIELGMIVEVSGPVVPYSGMQEIKGGTARIIDSNKHDVTPVDVTEKFANGDSLANYVGTLATIKGVEIKGQELGGTSEYLKFELNGKTSYVRTYVSDFPTTLGVTNDNGVYSSPNKAVIDEAHAAKFGYSADVTGIVVLYNSAPYFIPVGTDCFVYGNKIEKTPEQMVAEALEALTIPTFISENTTLELPATSEIHAGVTFSWTVDKEGYTITDNKIALTVSETAVELKFTATATCEGKTGTKEITVKVALPEMSIDEALKLDDGATVVLVGVVTEIKTAYSEQYGNISVTLKDATGELYLFRLTGNVAVGDVIKVTGKMGSYNGAKQLAAGGTFEKLTVSTSAEATAAADGTEVILAGKVTQINTEWSEQFGNITVTIADEAGTFYLFRLKANVKVGDELVVFGKVGSYNGAKQLAAGGTAIITKAAAEEGGETPEGPVEVTIKEALELDDGAEVILTGVVTEIKTAYSEQYGNISVTLKDATGELYLYRLTGNVAVGDVIKVTGKMGSYNGAKQLAQGGTFEAVTVSTSAEATAAEDGTEVVLAGKVTEINTPWSDSYGNITVTITDAAGTFYLYRLSANVVVGDEIVVFGKVGSYNGAKQLAQGGTAVIVKAAAVEPETPVDPSNLSSIEDVAAAYSWADATLYASFKLNDDVTVSATGTPVGTYGLNTGKFYVSNNSWRIYQNENPTLTITAAEGKTIVSVKITYSVKNYGVLTQDGAQIESGTVVTVNANSISFSVANTSDKTNGQAQITAIEVVLG